MLSPLAHNEQRSSDQPARSSAIPTPERSHRDRLDPLHRIPGMAVAAHSPSPRSRGHPCANHDKPGPSRTSGSVHPKISRPPGVQTSTFIGLPHPYRWRNRDHRGAHPRRRPAAESRRLGDSPLELSERLESQSIWDGAGQLDTRQPDSVGRGPLGMLKPSRHTHPSSHTPLYRGCVQQDCVQPRAARVQGSHR
jgi:hypothetical protein